MTAPNDRPTRLPMHLRANVTAEELLVLMSRLEGAESERDALREQVKTLREAASMSLSVLLAVANGETDDYPERCRAAATCARAALASTETEVQP